MKRLITILFIGVLSTLYSQQQNLNPNLITFPVSPEAARLGSFGNVPVNLFYGQLDKSIELFNGKVGDFNLPINLRYNYAGNRVEETPSIIGLGWQLNLGGVVTREVRGLPDEHPRGYNNLAVKNIMNDYLNNNVITQYDATKLAIGFYDTEVDKYNISVNGINFSFKIGLDGTPVFLSRHDYKVRVIRNENNYNSIEGFVMTDTNSNQYFFEEKEINEPYLGYSSFFEENFPTYTSAWQLSKIITNNDSEIFFNYDINDYMTYNFYASLHVRWEDNPVDPYNSIMAYNHNEGCTSDVIKRKILKSIVSPSFNLTFDYIKINNHEVYNKIIIKDQNNKPVNYYDFTYSENRNLLNKITKNNQFFYEFEYIGATLLPSFINSIYDYPRNQDEWGFANEAHNNFSVFYGGTVYNADKTPSFTNTVNGALSTIKYPTGGFTKIEYEPNSIAAVSSEKVIPNTRINLKFKSDFLPDSPIVKEQIFTKTFDSDVEATLSHSISNINFIDVSITNTEGCSHAYSDFTTSENTPYYTLIPHAKLTSGIPAPRICPSLNEVAQVDSNCLSSGNCGVNRDSGGVFVIPAGTYEFKFRTEYNTTQDVKAEITLDFYDYKVALDTKTVSTEKTGGIRVKQVADYPLNNNPIIKNYDYTYGATFNKQTIYYMILKKETCCANYKGQGIWLFDIPAIPNVADVNSRSFNLLLHSNSPVYYPKVIEYTNRSEVSSSKKFLCENCGGNFEGNWDGSKVYSYLGGIYGVKTKIYPEGYKLTTFETPKLKFSDFPFIPRGTDLSLGVISSNAVYSKNEIATLNKPLYEEINMYYDTDNNSYQNTNIIYNPNYPVSLKVDFKVKIIDGTSITSPFTVNDFFYFKPYKEYDLEKFVYNKTTKEYLNNDSVEKNVTIEYDTHNQQSKVNTTDSNNNVQTNELFYPYNFSDAVSLDMVSKNSISPLVQVVNKKNGEILESSKFEYGQISNNLFKPFSFSKSKGNNSLEKRNLFNYDSNGNIIVTRNIYPTGTSPGGATLYDGSTTTIIWGYNKTLPVAKIESLSNITVPATLITAIEAASSSTGTEAGLLSALNNLRNDTALANAMVTTYTHIPLVGVSTITDAKGDKITYTYDSFGRLQNVKDKNGNILSENEYHYKN
jgi:YD repeat-containing protein